MKNGRVALVSATIVIGSVLAWPTLADDASDRAALIRANEAFDATLSRRDPVALDSAWVKDEGATAIHPAGKMAVTGWDAVRQSWLRTFDTFPELSVTLRDPSVHVAGDTGWVIGIETVRGRRTNGETVEFAALTTNIYERRGGAWFLVHHHASRVPQ